MKLSIRFILTIIFSLAIPTVVMMEMALSFKEAENLSSEINAKLIPSLNVAKRISLQLHEQVYALRKAPTLLENEVLTKIKAHFDLCSELNRKHIQLLQKPLPDNETITDLNTQLTQLAKAGSYLFELCNKSRRQNASDFIHETITPLEEKIRSLLQSIQEQLEKEIEATSFQIQKQFKINSPKMFSLYLFALLGTLFLVIIVWDSHRKNFYRIRLALNKASNGDFTQYLEKVNKEEMREIVISYNNLMVFLGNFIREITSSLLLDRQKTEELWAAFQKVSSYTASIDRSTNKTLEDNNKLQASMQKMANASTEISQNAACISANIDTITSSINESIQQCVLGNKTADQAQNCANEITQQAELLEKSIDEILGFVRTVSSIADQTNMLALNATIEASSTGENGKGFAVVANEVKELAKKSTQTSNQIQTQTNQIQKNIQSTVSSIRLIARFISDLSVILQSITTQVKEEEKITSVFQNVAQVIDATKVLGEASKESLNISAGISKHVQSIQQESQNYETQSTQIRDYVENLEQATVALNSSLKHFKM